MQRNSATYRIAITSKQCWCILLALGGIASGLIAYATWQATIESGQAVVEQVELLTSMDVIEEGFRNTIDFVKESPVMISSREVSLLASADLSGEMSIAVIVRRQPWMKQPHANGLEYQRYQDIVVVSEIPRKDGETLYVLAALWCDKVPGEPLAWRTPLSTGGRAVRVLAQPPTTTQLVDFCTLWRVGVLLQPVQEADGVLVGDTCQCDATEWQRITGEPAPDFPLVPSGFRPDL